MKDDWTNHLGHEERATGQTILNAKKFTGQRMRTRDKSRNQWTDELARVLAGQTDVDMNSDWTNRCRRE